MWPADLVVTYLDGVHSSNTTYDIIISDTIHITSAPRTAHTLPVPMVQTPRAASGRPRPPDGVTAVTAAGQGQQAL